MWFKWVTLEGVKTKTSLKYCSTQNAQLWLLVPSSGMFPECCCSDLTRLNLSLGSFLSPV